ncbi:peptidoglycan-recognition protein SC2 isoform X2 [Bicyclus anynana]|uniref:Peptidoglycan-recognition protein SC2 isoform X2 n=1 Tax=Bicyclus anynana TaxID=110368 RepID=A0A6J1N7S1_BICAN|nr:peptidoglycan-recognition protein SC2 isoform X2 [Bicyclus anynana]
MWAANGVVPAEPARDVALMDERTVSAIAAVPAPHIDTINVTQSSKVHVGTKVVSITQNVHNKEMLKGRFLGLELVSSKHSRRLRCSVAVFVCWAFLVVSGLVIYLIYVALPKPTRLDIGLNATWYLRRDEWQALASNGEDFLKLPLSYVIIGHSAANNCTERYMCIKEMLDIQLDHMKLSFADIGPNFLVGGNGDVFEGRGANVFGAMVTSWNRRSISIMFLGNYVTFEPREPQFNHTNILLETLVKEGVLRRDYVLYGQCQLLPQTISPGPRLVAQLGHFKQWNKTGKEGCLHG